MSIVPAKIDPKIQKEALKLFAAGYRPLKRSASNKIGKIDIAKIRQRRGSINPYLLMELQGVEAYSKNKMWVDSKVYYVLYKLTRSANHEVYQKMCEQHNA